MNLLSVPISEGKTVILNRFNRNYFSLMSFEVQINQ